MTYNSQLPYTVIGVFVVIKFLVIMYSDDKNVFLELISCFEQNSETLRALCN